MPNSDPKVAPLSAEKKAEFEALARPIIKFLNENRHPHTVAMIHPGGAGISEAVCSFATDDYVPD